MTMSNPVATLFGGTGFLGRHTVRKLAAGGWTIRVATRTPSDGNVLRTAGTVGQIVPVGIDPFDDRQLEAAIAGASLVVNFVGILQPSGRLSFDRVHAALPRRIGAAAARQGVARLVHISAIGADPAASADYAASKGRGEMAIRKEFPAATILRPSIVFGPEDQFFNRFARMARLSPVLPLIGGGHTRFQPVWVGDVAEAIARVAADPSTPGRIFELGGPAVHSFKELLELLLLEIRRSRLFVSLPFPLASLQARMTEWLPFAPMTVDQVELLKRDNIVAPGAETFAALGIEPSAMGLILPTYLDRFRKGGRFADQRDYSLR